jgi:hypothetical protein
MSEEMITALFIGGAIFLGVKAITKTVKLAIKIGLVVGGLAYLGFINV